MAQTPEGRLRSWVEANYTHIPLREKDTGTKREALLGAYTSAASPVHQKPLGKILFGKMLQGGICRHRASQERGGHGKWALLAPLTGDPLSSGQSTH